MNFTKLQRYAQLVTEWPGLVGPTGKAELELLIEDSLVLLEHLDEDLQLVDVGSGGGMPGLVLKLVRPELQVTLIEANRRKAAFLRFAAAELGAAVEVIDQRAELVGQGEARERFPLAVCRALAAMPVLLELCLPLVEVGGRLLAQKGVVEPCDQALRSMGGATMKILPAPSRARSTGVVVEVLKLHPTPPQYPRRPGIPARRPLK
ncbi:MAG: 16S rRNA (guanine(527)-N(7))-methyltransferase RsmG [Candidatus Dormibacteraceae bacterium]